MVKPCSRNKNSPLVRLQNKYERYGTENNVLSGRGLARRPLSARRVHIKMTSHVAQCIHNTSYCAARELCRLQIWTKRYREHFTVLVIWTLVYREHVPRTFCQGFVPRTYMNGLIAYLSEQQLLPMVLDKVMNLLSPKTADTVIAAFSLAANENASCYSALFTWEVSPGISSLIHHSSEFSSWCSVNKAFLPVHPSHTHRQDTVG